VVSGVFKERRVCSRVNSAGCSGSQGASSRLGVFCGSGELRGGIFKLFEGAQESIPPAYVACAGIFKQSIGLGTE
jgi:hypothetical protein